MKNKVTLLNMISGFILQLCIIISGFIIPKIILKYFGSDVNGLIASLSQFLSYITLMEGGVNGVIGANLFKPICEKNEKKISAIIATANKFYKKIVAIFIAYSLILAFLYPLLVKTEFSYIYVFSLILILSFGLCIQYMFSITLKTFLNSTKEGYIVSTVQIVIILLNIVLAIASVKIFPSIHFLKMISSLLFILQPICYGIYVKKHYKIDKKAQVDNNLIKNRWNAFAVNLANFIHNSVDVTLLTCFSDLLTVSIYSVYSLVTNGIRQLINSLISALSPTLGYAYAKKDAFVLNQKLDLYEYIILILVFFIFTVAGLLITPFVMIYTKGITDVNYYQPLFGILLVIAEAISILKFPQMTLAYVANKYKEITIPTFIEAGINIIVSIILLKSYGIIGVAIGTITAMTYRLVFQVSFVKKIFKERNNNEYYLKILKFVIPIIIAILFCCYVVPPVQYNLINWLSHAIIYSLIVGLTCFIVSIIFFRKEIIMIKEYLKH